MNCTFSKLSPIVQGNNFLIPVSWKEEIVTSNSPAEEGSSLTFYCAIAVLSPSLKLEDVQKAIHDQLCEDERVCSLENLESKLELLEHLP